MSRARGTEASRQGQPLVAPRERDLEGWIPPPSITTLPGRSLGITASRAISTPPLHRLVIAVDYDRES
jgi:hypothetical protein